MRERVARFVSWLSVVAFVQTAIGHALTFGTFSNDPALWFVFPAQQLALGAIVTIALWKKAEITRLILACVAFAPLIEAALIGIYNGPIVPFFLVLTSGLLPTLAAALTMVRKI